MNTYDRISEMMGALPDSTMTEVDTLEDTTQTRKPISSAYDRINEIMRISPDTMVEEVEEPETIGTPKTPETITPETVEIAPSTQPQMTTTEIPEAPETTQPEKKWGKLPAGHPDRWQYTEVGDPPRLMMVYDPDPNLEGDLSKAPISEPPQPPTMVFKEPEVIKGGIAPKRDLIPPAMPSYGAFAPPIQPAQPKAKEKIKEPEAPPSRKPQYGLGNIDLANRPKIENEDGTISTIESVSFNEDGKEILIPKVREGLDRIMTDDEAVDWYHQTGEYLGKFDNADEATKYGQLLHDLQEAQLYTAPQSVSRMEFEEPAEVKPSEISEPYVPPSPTPSYGAFGVPMASPPAIKPQEKLAAYAQRGLAAGKQLIAPEVAKTARLQPTQEKREEQAKRATELPKEAMMHGKAAEILDPTWYTSEKIRERVDRIRGQDPNLANSFDMGDIVGAAEIALTNASMSGDETAINTAYETLKQAREVAGQLEKKRKDRKGFTGGAANVLEATAGILPMMGKGMAMNAIPVVGPALSTSMWAKQGAGDIIAELKEKGVPNDVALGYGLAGGIAYALVEGNQVGLVGNIAFKKAIGESVKKRIMNVVKQKGIDWFKEVGEEGLQRIVTENTIINALKEAGVDVSREEMKERYKKAFTEDIKGSAWPMAILSLIGAGGGIARTAYTGSDVAPQITEMVDEKTGETRPLGEAPTTPAKKPRLGYYNEKTGEIIKAPNKEYEHLPLVEYDEATGEIIRTQEKEKSIEEIEQQAKEAVQPKPKETEADLPSGETVTEPVEKQPVPAPEKMSPTEEKEIKKEVDAVPRDDSTEKKEIEQININPSEGQKEAGNYRKAHIKRDGFDISLENAAGSERRNKDPNGKKWAQKINHDYGYIRGTKGADAFRDAESTDQVDVFIKPNSSEGGSVYIVNQVDPGSGEFDEHKVMMGFDSETEAKKAYLSNYEKGWKGLGSIVEMPMDEFKEWVYTDATEMPVPKKPIPKPQEKEKPSAKETGETVGETGRKEGIEGGEEGRIRVRDTKKYGLETKTGKDIKTPKGVIAEVSNIPKKANLKNTNVYEPVLDLNKKPTGWIRPKNNKSILIDPESRKQVVFKAKKPGEATAKAKTNTAASGYAINNPIIQEEKQAVTEQVRERLGIEPETKEMEREPTSKVSRKASVSPTKSTEGKSPAAKEEKKEIIGEKEKPAESKPKVSEGSKQTPKAKEKSKESKEEEYDVIDGSGKVTTKGYSGAQSNEAMGLSLEPEVDVKGKPVSKHTIADKLGELSNTPIRVGRFRGKSALGIFKVRPREIRVREAGNIPVVAHEIGHALERNVLEMMQFDSNRWPAIRKELSALGKALYGKNRPSNGYISEGWAEYWNYFFAKGDKLKKYAPATDSYVRNVFFKDNPKFQKRVEELLGQIEIYKKQGAIEETASQIVPEEKDNIIKSVIEQLNKENFIEEAAGIETAVKRMNAIKADNVKVYEMLLENLEEWKTRELKQNPSKEKQILKKYDHLSKKYKNSIAENKEELTTSKNPFTAFKALRRTAPSIVKYMAERGMIDSHRRVVGRPLSDATKLIRKYKSGRRNFEAYLYARRAQEYHRLGLDPGIPLKRANHTVKKMEKDFPDFSIAAKMVHDWNRGILNYVNELGAIPDDTVAKIKEKWDFYFPFERVFPYETKALKKMKGKQILYGAKGSALPIKNPFETMLKDAERVIDAAHQRYVLDRLFELKDVEGIGEIMVEVPRSMVPNSFKIEDIKKQLEEAGINLDEIDLTEMVTTFTPAKRGPKGEPIIPKVVNVKQKKIVDGKEKIVDKDVIKWFYVDEGLYNALEGMNKINTLGPLVDFFLGKPARTFKMGTTGLRASFSLSNATKDFMVALQQASGKKDPEALLKFLAYTIKSDYGKLIEISGGKPNEFNDLFDRLGLPMSQALGLDIKQTRRAAKDLFRGKAEKIIKNPVDFLRDVIQITEGGPRTATIEKMAKERGIDINNMTMDQMFDLIIEGSEVTTDFRAMGKYIRDLNQVSPFLNPNIQGKRQFAKTWKRDPKTAILIGLITMTLPALYNWFRNKDEDWYQELPYFEKYMYENIESGDNIVRIPKAHEWALIFQTIPVAMIDAAYHKDPEGVKELIKNIINSEVPSIMPHTFRILKEQWRDEVDFTGRPIVSKADKEKPGPEQYGPYTSKISIGLANMFRQLNWSPNRIDHIIRSSLGGIGQDILSVTRNEKSTVKELANIPVVGRFFRWGGKYTFRNKYMDEYYELYDKYRELGASKYYKYDKDVKDILAGFGNVNDELKIYRMSYKNAESNKDRQTIAKSTTDKIAAFLEDVKTLEEKSLIGGYIFRNKTMDEYYDLYDKYRGLEDLKGIKPDKNIENILIGFENINNKLDKAEISYKNAKSNKERKEITKKATDNASAFLKRVKLQEEKTKSKF